MGIAVIAFVAGIVIGGYVIPGQVGSQFGGMRLAGCRCYLAVSPNSGATGAGYGIERTAATQVTVGFLSLPGGESPAGSQCVREALRLSVSGLPSSVTATFSKNDETPTFSSTLTFNVGPFPIGGPFQFPVTITASGTLPGSSCSGNYTLKVIS